MSDKPTVEGFKEFRKATGSNKELKKQIDDGLKDQAQPMVGDAKSKMKSTVSGKRARSVKMVVNNKGVSIKEGGTKTTVHAAIQDKGNPTKKGRLGVIEGDNALEKAVEENRDDIEERIIDEVNSYMSFLGWELD